MPVILRAALAVPLLLPCLPRPVLADAPPPSQALASDPAPPRPVVGLSADGAAIVLGDYAARLDLSVLPALSLTAIVGASHRRATDDVLVELGATLWPLGLGLEGPLVTTLLGLAWVGPWSQAEGAVLRCGGEAGWQFLWESLSISLAAGAYAAYDPPTGAWAPEPHARVALGLVL